jgi:hypothetical protein
MEYQTQGVFLMNYAFGAASLMACSTCFGGITGLTDHRSVNVSYLYYNEPYTIEGGYSQLSADVNAAFEGSFFDTQSDPGFGLFIDTVMTYSSSVSSSGFSSSSYANSYSIEPSVGFTFVTMAFSNQVVFELDSVTTFSIAADFLSAGADDGGIVQFERLVDGVYEVAYSVQSLNSIMSVDDLLTLEAGTYRYSAINWVSIDTIGRDSDVGISSLTAEVDVVPAPGALMGLIGFGIAASGGRRRR